ncbi:MAG: phosphoribosylanthranilate isomerase [Longimicrobiales bacterium]|nr:phosphoribosylanthranilate isomerase [Longimicrobiales bacterium]
MIPSVKICGLTRPVDVRSAVDAGAGYLGVVMVPSSPRNVSVDQVRTLRKGIDVPLVLVTADRDPDELAEQARVLEAGGLQLHGDESPENVERLREAGDWELWKSVRIREAGDLDEAIDRFGDLVDAIHLDGWHPEQLGGTGVRFPWNEVAEVRDRLPDGTALVAAGGLTPENVGQAVALLRPDVVDVSSGVEAEGRPGIKDPAKVRAFVRAARSVAAR